MPHYIRNYQPGASYFFTVALLERRRNLLTENIDALRMAFQSVQQKYPFRTDAAVALPDHLHCIWTLPETTADYSTRWRLIKSAFSRAIDANERLSKRHIKKSERGIWQRRFWEHTIRDERDFETHCDHIHFNPVKHGLVRCVADWPHSSFHQFVARGVYPRDWAAPEDIRELEIE